MKLPGFTKVPLLVLCCVPFIVCQSFRNGYPSQPQAPTGPIVPQCFSLGFPGTPAWNNCWNNFQDSMNGFQNRMNLFTQQMQQYQAQLRQYTEKLASSTDQRNTIQIGTTNIISNGYIIRSKGLSLSTSSFDTVFMIDTEIGNPEDVKVTTKDKTIRWEVINKGQPTKWISMIVPDSVDVSSIKYETKNNRLNIAGPTASGFGNLSVSSINSGDGFSNFGSTFSFF